MAKESCKMCAWDAFGEPTGSCPLTCGRALMAFLDTASSMARIAIDFRTVKRDDGSRVHWADRDGQWDGSFAAARSTSNPYGELFEWYIRDLQLIQGRKWVPVNKVEYTLDVEVLFSWRPHGGRAREDRFERWLPATIRLCRTDDPNDIRM